MQLSTPCYSGGFYRSRSPYHKGRGLQWWRCLWTSKHQRRTPKTNKIPKGPKVCCYLLFFSWNHGKKRCFFFGTSRRPHGHEVSYVEKRLSSGNVLGLLTLEAPAIGLMGSVALGGKSPAFSGEWFLWEVRRIGYSPSRKMDN